MKNNVTLSGQGLRSFRIALFTASMLLASLVLSVAQNRIDKSLIPFTINDGKLITLRDVTIHSPATITIPQTFIAGFTSDLYINFGNGTTLLAGITSSTSL